MAMTGKAAVVTGAAEGLGRAIAVAFLQEKARVCLLDLQAEKGEATLSALQDEYGAASAIFVQCDVANAQQFECAFQRALSAFTHVDVMVNNAAVLDESNWETTLLTNLGGVIRGSELAIRHMRRDQGGRGGVILNVSSMAVAGQSHCTPTYTASKCGVLAYTNSWAVNPYLGELGLRFLCLCPGLMDTRMQHVHDHTFLWAEDRRHNNKGVPVLDPEAVAREVVRLVLDESSNGQMLGVTQSQGFFPLHPHVTRK